MIKTVSYVLRTILFLIHALNVILVIMSFQKIVGPVHVLLKAVKNVGKAVHAEFANPTTIFMMINVIKDHVVHLNVICVLMEIPVNAPNVHGNTRSETTSNAQLQFVIDQIAKLVQRPLP
jgi:hypothetical protein